MNKLIRKEYNLNQNWKFYYGDVPEAWQKGYDDSKWEDIIVPHDWAVKFPFDKKHSSGTGYLPGGKGYYRARFNLPEELKGKKIFIKFDGVYNNSMVWCNSYYIGKRPNGYVEFIYDISDFASFGDNENVVTVRVNHKDIADSRWFTGSGVYRKVTVIAKDNMYIDNYGVFIKTKSLDSKKAVLSVDTNIVNETGSNKKVTVKNMIYDSDGNLVSEAGKKIEIDSNNRETISQDIVVNDPKLWSTKEPNLYTCLTQTLENHEILDEEKATIGIREFKFDKDKGFFLNGKNMKLKGVCVHHDAGVLGAAVRKKVWKRRLETLKDMGCNAIRMSHNPHMPELYDLCDEMGFVVIDEAFDEWEGVKNKWSQGHNVYPPKHYGYYEDFPAWHKKDLESLILRDRNHPSIALWSVGNEIDYPNDPYCHEAFETMTGNNDKNKPSAEKMYDPNKPNAKRLVTIGKELVSIVKGVDNTRPVTIALAFPELSNITGFADCFDVVGYNYKEHLYEENHKKYPEHILLGSENSKTYKAWEYVTDNDYIAGQFLWTGIDFLGETRGWPSHGSEAGLIDTAGFPKPEYYFRKSLWYSEKTMKIFAVSKDVYEKTNPYVLQKKFKRNWDFDKGEEVVVICFTNCEDVRLYLDDKELKDSKLSDYDEGYIKWDITYSEGKLKAIGIDSEENKVCEDALIQLNEAKGFTLEALDNEIKADGLDMTHVILNVLDGNGNFKNDSDEQFEILIEGPGILMGIDNGKLDDTTEFTSSKRRVKNGRAIIYVSSTSKKGDITVKAISENIGEEEVVIEAK